MNHEKNLKWKKLDNGKGEDATKAGKSLSRAINPVDYSVLRNHFGFRIEY